MFWEFRERSNSRRRDEDKKDLDVGCYYKTEKSFTHEKTKKTQIQQQPSEFFKFSSFFVEVFSYCTVLLYSTGNILEISGVSSG